MKHEELVKLVKELEKRVAVLERIDPAASRINCQEDKDGEPRLIAGATTKDLFSTLTRRAPNEEEKFKLPERCRALLELAREGGLLGEDWRPRVSLTDAALMVNYIRQEVDVPWGAFERMWGVKHLRNYYNKSTYLVDFDERSDRVLDVLGLGKCLGSFLTDDRQSR